jgi:hypothetical protein
MKKILKVTALSLIVLTMAISKGHAQGTPVPGGGGPGVNGSGGFTPPSNSGGGDGAVPFDGGLSLILLAAGAGVGARKKNMVKN